ncbi:VOC family protein [Congregibacter sp.]|uniref:VOC family protein n=1 Tax=Congregibacter sp. TaxID=2744308 RepID=UPI003F6D14AF
MTSPILAIDHVTISVADLDRETANYAALLDIPPVQQVSQGGRHSSIFRTPNVAVHLVASEQAKGLEAVCFAVDSLSRLHRRLDRVGITSMENALDTKNSSDTQPLRRADEADTRGIQIAFLEQPKESATTAPEPPGGLDHIVIASAQSEGTAFLLGSQLGLDLRMDMSRQEWNARLMFFRCGDLIVEVFEQLKQETPAQLGDQTESRALADSFYGLTWRVEDADASRSRLSNAGFNVSDVRKGRKPGSRVLTVRDKTAGVATLLIELPKS